MDWLEITVVTNHEGIAALEALLYSHEIGGLAILDEQDFDEFLQANEPRWDFVDEALTKKMRQETKVTFYLPDSPSGRETLRAVQAAVKHLKEESGDRYGSLAMQIGDICEEDWANNWKQYFHPIPIGEKILIRPVWEDTPNPEGRIVFSVDPGMTFGSGQHETTQLCIEAMEKLIFPGARVLDLGAGSGILSIISLLLGASSVTAVDVDPYCDKIIRQNAQMNGFDQDAIAIRIGDLTSDTALLEELAQGQYDVILANIVADVIVALAPFAAPLMKKDSRFLCSGIIDTKADRVLTALSQNGFEVLQKKQAGDWIALVCAH